MWCQVGLGSNTTNKAGGVDGILAELFQILKDDAVKVLHSICQQIWKTQQWPQDWKKSVFIPIPKKGNAKEGLSSQSYGFSSSHVWMWKLDHEEGWALKNWCFWTVVLEKTLESPLDSQSKSTLNIHWRTEAEALILWPPDGKSWSTGKDLNPGKDWGQEEKEVTEDERVG